MTIKVTLMVTCDVDGIAPDDDALTGAFASALMDAVPGVVEVSDNCVLLMNSFEFEVQLQ